MESRGSFGWHPDALPLRGAANGLPAKNGTRLPRGKALVTVVCPLLGLGGRTPRGVRFGAIADGSSQVGNNIRPLLLCMNREGEPIRSDAAGRIVLDMALSIWTC